MLKVVSRVPRPPKIGCRDDVILISCHVQINMAGEFTTSNVASAISEIAGTIERLDNPGNLEMLKLRLDYVNRMLVTLDVPEEIVNTMCSVYESLENVATDERSANFRAQSTSFTGRGRPQINISREQLAFLLDQGFTAGEMSAVLSVWKRTEQRRLAAFDLRISGK